MATTPEGLAKAIATPATLELTERQRRQALAVCIAAAFLTLLDVSIVTTALPSMERQLNMSPADATWAIAGYTLTFGLTLIPAGRLGDELGRRRIFLVGMLLFAATGVLSGLAPDAVWLDATRLARGVTAGLVAPQVVGMLQQMYPPRERGRAFGYYGATVGLSTAVGPLLGGVIIQAFGTTAGWRYIFYLFIPLAVLTLVLGMRVLPEDRRSGQHRAFDAVGAVTLALAVTAIMLPLIQSGQGHIPRPWLMGVGALLLVVFVRRERAVARGGRQPLVDLTLFRVRNYWVGALVAAAFYGGFTGVFLVMSQYLQQGLHYTALQAALSTLAFTIGSAVCGVISGRFVHRVGRSLVIGGSAATALGLGAAALLIRSYGAAGNATVAATAGGRGTGALARVGARVGTQVGQGAGSVAGSSAGHNIGLILIVPLLVAGCGAGCVIAANQTLALHRVPRKEGSTSAGLYQTGMKVGTSVGTALASALFFNELATTHGSFATAASVGMTASAALAGVAFLVALPGFTLRVRESAPTVAGREEVEMAR
jgi:EmrB/QacA subfamily drug resistance transporter